MYLQVTTGDTVLTFLKWFQMQCGYAMSSNWCIKVVHCLLYEHITRI